MFTGIVTDIGSVEGVQALPKGRRFRIATAYDPATIDIGALDRLRGRVSDRRRAARGGRERPLVRSRGVGGSPAADHGRKLGRGHPHQSRAGPEGGRRTGRPHRVRPCRRQGTNRGARGGGDAVRFRIEAPEALARFIAPKGSVALDGTSLTVNAVDGNVFDVLLILHSLSVTTWGAREVGDALNLEVDTMARYAARLMETRG